MKISRKWSLIWFLIRNLWTCKLQLSAMRIFKIPEITSTVEFLSSEASNKQQLKPPKRTTSVLEKDFLMDVLLHKKLQKSKINTSKGKINFLKQRRWRQCQYWYLGTKIHLQKIECEHCSENIIKLLSSIHIWFL